MTESVLFAQTKDGTQRVELPQATIDSYTFRLNQPGSLTASIAPRKLPDGDGGYTVPLSDVLEPGVHELGVRRGGSVVWLGPCWQLDETDGPDGPSVQVAAEGLLSYLAKALISLDLPGSSPPGQFHDTDQADIVASMLEHFVAKGSGWANIDDTGIAATGVLRDRTEYQKYRGLVVLDEIEKLSEVEDGFDFDIDPATRRFRLHYPTQGRRRDNVTFNPANVLDFRRTIDAKEQFSVVIGHGDGFAEGTIRNGKVDSVASAKYGATERALAMSNVTRSSTVAQNTAAFLRQVKDPPQVLSVQVRFGANLPYGSFGIGDEIRVDWPASVYSPVSAYRRVVGIDIHPHPDETATIHLAELGAT